MFSYSSTNCWRDYLCSIVLPLLFCQRSVGYIYVNLFLSILFCSVDLLVYCFTYTMLSGLLPPYCKSWGCVGSVLQFCYFLSILCWLFWVFCLCIQTLESVCQYLLRKLLRSCLELHWINRPSWEELTSQQYCLPIQEDESLPIDLVLWFHSSEYCLYRFYTYFVRFIPKYFFYFWCNANVIVFLISNSTCSWLVHWK